MRIVRAALLTISALAGVVAPAFAAAPAWDNSGNGQLSGAYYFRQVLYVTDGGGNTSQALAFYGNLNFSSGTYTVTAGTLLISGPGSAPQSFNPTGTYSVSASGYGFMSSPLTGIIPTGVNGTEYFLVSNHILVGSETESGYNEMMIAAPVGSLSLSSFSGAYTIDAFFIGGTPATSLNATYQLNPNNGSLGTVGITGTAGTGTSYSQSSANVKYIYANGAFPITFPTSTTAAFYSGQVYLYMSPDTNFVFGGSPLGFDMFVGVKNSSGTPAPFTGLYYETGLDQNTSYGLDTYYGAINAFQQGSLDATIEHERIFYNGDSAAEGDAYYNYYPNSNVPVTYTIGQSGARIGVGTGAYLSLNVSLPYTPPAPSGSVYLDPTGIVNTASSEPYTAGISPGDFITLYNGVNLASGNFFAAPGAFPTSLGGVTVYIDGIAAPLYYVTPTQISALVPYAVGTYPVASIQVKNASGLSNIVTAYVHQTTPGAFTFNPSGGIGSIAAQHGDYSLITSSNPAQPGEYIAIYLTGLGTPFPPNGDGQLGGTSCVSGSCLVNDVAIDLNGVDVGTLAFSGLAPDLAGLYQVNFQIPALCTATLTTGCLSNGAGSYNVGISGLVPVTGGSLLDSYSDESYIPVGTGSSTAATAAVQQAPRAAAPARTRRTPPRLTGSLPRTDN